MTPPRKLSTTAIAAMAALSTVFAGVTPAVAADNSATTNSPVGDANATEAAGLNISDGSKLPEGTAKTEVELRDATDKIGEEIKGYGSLDTTKKLGEIFAAAGDMSQVALNDTEEGALNALRAELAKVSASLKQAAQNQADAAASVNAALDADRKADAAWKKVVDYFAGLTVEQRTAVNKLVTAVNDENQTGEANIKLLNVTAPVTPEEAEEFCVQMYKHISNSHLLTADKTEDHYVSRQYLMALEALQEDTLVKDFYQTFLDAKAAVYNAQRSDVITREMFLERSRAQVLVLRLQEARLAVAVRMIELYENSESMDNGAAGHTTVREYYRDVAINGNKANLEEAWTREYARLTAADEAAKKLFKGWDNDLANDGSGKDQEQPAYEKYRASEAHRTYKDIVADEAWQIELEKAQTFDRKAFATSAAAKQAVQNEIDAKAKAAEDAKKAAEKANADREKAIKDAEAAAKKADELAKKLAEAEKKLNDKKTDNDGDHPTPAPKKKDGEFPLVPVAIVGVVLAVLAAIAANFPMLLAALPKA